MDWYTAGMFSVVLGRCSMGFVCCGDASGRFGCCPVLYAAGPGMLLLWFLVLVGVLFGVSLWRKKRRSYINLNEKPDLLSFCKSLEQISSMTKVFDSKETQQDCVSTSDTVCKSSCPTKPTQTKNAQQRTFFFRISSLPGTRTK